MNPVNTVGISLGLLLWAARCCAPFATAAAQNTPKLSPPNLLANGSFEDGNVGFTSGYIFATEATTAPGQEGHYTISTNPHLINGLGASFGDHTTGKGKMLIVNGSTNAEGQVVWEQAVVVKPRTVYRFSFWVASWGRNGDTEKAASPAQLEARINGERLFAPATGGSGDNITAATPAILGQWHLVSFWWESGSSTKARLTLVDRNYEFVGNDFALDDMAFESRGDFHELR